jgi:hexosaminidase
MKLLPVIALLASCTLAISACGGSSNGSSSGGNTGTSTAGSTEAGNTEAGGTEAGGTEAGSTDNGTNTGGPDTNASLLDAGLSHSGTAIASVPATQNDPLVLQTGADRVAALSDSLAIMYEVATNQGTSVGLQCADIGAQYNACSVVNLHIKDAANSLSDNTWKLYFHSTRRVLQVQSDEFSVTHVNGDLHYVAPTDAFSGFNGGVKTVKMITEFNHLVETDFQPRYWVAQGGRVTLIANTDNETDENAYAMEITGNNRFEFVGENNAIASTATRHARNSEINTAIDTLSASSLNARIIPRPTSLTQTAGSVAVNNSFNFVSLGLPADSLSALNTRQAQFIGGSTSTPVQGAIDNTMSANTYTLSVQANGTITLTASDQAMMFYAAQSLLALFDPQTNSLPIVEVSDSPRFGFRGMHIDVARNFHSVASIKRLLDQMAAYKMNKLHLHLSDDEGWRLEIPSFPELTSVAAKREFNLDADGNVTETNSLMPGMGSGPFSSNQGSGFFSRADFVDLLKYANARFIEVIPEFDMPAHARAAVVGMRARAYNTGDALNLNVRIDDPNDTSRYLTVQNYNDSFINPCVPGTYNFLETVITEVKSMYTDAGLPFNVWHMGGDEAVNILLSWGFPNPDRSASDEPWAASPVCDDFIANTAEVSSRNDLTPYFINRVSQIVANAGIPTLYAYQDIYGSLSANELATTSAGVGFWARLSDANTNNSNATIDLANSFVDRGFETILGNPDYLYFDFPYEVDPKERGYYWAARQISTEKVFRFTPENLSQNAALSQERYGNPWSASASSSSQGYQGMQGFLWSETVRTPEQFDYMLFPRLLALAERAWHAADWELEYIPGTQFSNQSTNVDRAAVELDYASFAKKLADTELSKLDAAGVQYRIPLPSVEPGSSNLNMQVEFKGLTTQYSADGNSWQTYNPSAAPTLDSVAFVRTLSANGARASRAVPVEQ